MIFRSIVLLFLLFATRPLHAQDTITARSTLVLVPALVRDKAGSIVFTLTADDFALTDDGIAQKITLEQDTGGEPLALVVVLQAGAATQTSGWHPEDRSAPQDRFHSLSTMVEAMAGNVPHTTAVVGFESHPMLLQTFTTDADAIASTIHKFTATEPVGHGSAILDSLGFAVDLLRKQPPTVRRAILLLSETNDRGSVMTLDQALRAISDTNTAIYSIAYSTGYAEASQYGHKVLPTKRVPPRKPGSPLPPTPPAEPLGKVETLARASALAAIAGISFENPNPNPPHGCMGKDLNALPGETQSKASQGFDCLTQFAPPLALAKMAAIAAIHDMSVNIPESVARLTGGEYFKLNTARNLERDLTTIAGGGRDARLGPTRGPHRSLVLRVRRRRGSGVDAQLDDRDRQDRGE